MFLSVLLAAALISVVFLTCGGPTRQERTRDQAEKIYAEITGETVEQTCIRWKEAARQAIRRGAFDVVLTTEVVEGKEIPRRPDELKGVLITDREEVLRELWRIFERAPGELCPELTVDR